MASLLAPTITNLYLVRSDERLTQAEFAARLGIDSSYVCKLENADASCSDELLSLIYSVFDVSNKYGKPKDWLLAPYDRRFVK